MGRQIKGADEQDAYTGWRRVLYWQRHERKKIKRRTHQRERRDARDEIRGSLISLDVPPPEIVPWNGEAADFDG